MKTKVPPVATWVRNTICVLAVSAVPGMVIVSCFGATMNLAMVSAVATVAICSANLAFGNIPESEIKAPRRSERIRKTG